MTAAAEVVLFVERDNATGGVRVSINALRDGVGHGYRISGPKHLSRPPRTSPRSAATSTWWAAHSGQRDLREHARGGVPMSAERPCEAIYACTERGECYAAANGVITECGGVPVTAVPSSGTTALTAVLAEIRAEHVPVEAGGALICRSCGEFHGVYPCDAIRLASAVEAVLALHRDRGASQGYTPDGYDVIDHCCGTCGTFGEYGEPWPCPTVAALTAALTPTTDRTERPADDIR